THYHPEHAGGESGSPPGTILIRNAVQQREAETYGPKWLEQFRSRNAQMAELLAGVTALRTPDVLFDREATLDLGGVTAKLMWLGEGHTKGDELIFVEPDGTLISGDIVQNKYVPVIVPVTAGDGGTFSGWLAELDTLAT